MLETTTEVAARFRIQSWRVRRLFEDGTLSEPERIGGRRLIPSALLPQIEAALRKRGWLITPGAIRVPPPSPNTVGDQS